MHLVWQCLFFMFFCLHYDNNAVYDVLISVDFEGRKSDIKYSVIMPYFSTNFTAVGSSSMTRNLS